MLRFKEILLEGSMKIKPEDYKKIKDAIGAFIKKKGVKAIKEYRMQKLGKDPEKRFRWDLLYATELKIGDGKGIEGDVNLYAYMDDRHIDTALKSIVDEFSEIKID